MRLSVRGSRYHNMRAVRPAIHRRRRHGRWRPPSARTGAASRCWSTFTQVIGNRAINEIKAGHDLFHWNQFAHVKNADSLPGMTAGLGAPVITLRGLTLGQSHAAHAAGHRRTGLTRFATTSRCRSIEGRPPRPAAWAASTSTTSLFETVCNGCMGSYDLQGGRDPASNIDWAAVVPDVNDVTTWNLDPLSPLARQYQPRHRDGLVAVFAAVGQLGLHGIRAAPRRVPCWVQDDWQMSPRLTLNLGLRYDLSVDQYVNWVVYPPFLAASRVPQDTNNFAPRLGFAYSLNDRTVRPRRRRQVLRRSDRPACSLHAADVQSDQPQCSERRARRTSPPTRSTVRRRPTSRLAAPVRGPRGRRVSAAEHRQHGRGRSPSSRTATRRRSAWPRQLGSTCRSRRTTRTRGTAPSRGAATATSRTTRILAPTTRSPVLARTSPSASIRRMARSASRARTRQDKNHAVQFAFNKRMSNNWQASATYLIQGQWNYDNYPLMPGCEYPYTIRANESARCDVPVTLPADIAEGRYFLAGDQRHRFTFNGIWQLPYDFQLSGIYLFGDNGKNTPSSGVDTRAIGNSGGRLRANGTLIDRNSFDRSAIHRFDMRVQRRLRLGSRVAHRRDLRGVQRVQQGELQLWTTNESSASYGKPEQDANVAFSPRMLQLGFRTTF